MEKANSFFRIPAIRLPTYPPGSVTATAIILQKLQETHRIITFRIQGEEFTMSSPFHRLRQSYGDMSLQSKFTIVLILAVSIPVIMIRNLFLQQAL